LEKLCYYAIMMYKNAAPEENLRIVKDTLNLYGPL
jgi:hypothetical protein